MGEHPVVTAKAHVMLYDTQDESWVFSGNSRGVAKVQLYFNADTNSYRVVGWSLQDKEVVINCSIPRGLKYHRARPNFHQWRDNKQQVYGLSFTLVEEGETFAAAVESALEFLSSLHRQHQHQNRCPEANPSAPQQQKICLNVDRPVHQQQTLRLETAQSMSHQRKLSLDSAQSIHQHQNLRLESNQVVPQLQNPCLEANYSVRSLLQSVPLQQSQPLNCVNKTVITPPQRIYQTSEPKEATQENAPILYTHQPLDSPTNMPLGAVSLLDQQYNHVKIGEEFPAKVSSANDSNLIENSVLSSTNAPEKYTYQSPSSFNRSVTPFEGGSISNGNSNVRYQSSFPDNVAPPLTQTTSSVNTPSRHHPAPPPPPPPPPPLPTLSQIPNRKASTTPDTLYSENFAENSDAEGDANHNSLANQLHLFKEQRLRKSSQLTDPKIQPNPVNGTLGRSVGADIISDLQRVLAARRKANMEETDDSEAANSDILNNRTTDSDYNSSTVGNSQGRPNSSNHIAATTPPAKTPSLRNLGNYATLRKTATQSQSVSRADLEEFKRELVSEFRREIAHLKTDIVFALSNSRT